MDAKVTRDPDGEIDRLVASDFPCVFLISIFTSPTLQNIRQISEVDSRGLAVLCLRWMVIRELDCTRVSPKSNLTSLGFSPISFTGHSFQDEYLWLAPRTKHLPDPIVNRRSPPFFRSFDMFEKAHFAAFVCLADVPQIAISRIYEAEYQIAARGRRHTHLFTARSRRGETLVET
jgi:hypothetical protein